MMNCSCISPSEPLNEPIGRVCAELASECYAMSGKRFLIAGDDAFPGSHPVQAVLHPNRGNPRGAEG